MDFVIYLVGKSMSSVRRICSYFTTSDKQHILSRKRLRSGATSTTSTTSTTTTAALTTRTSSSYSSSSSSSSYSAASAAQDPLTGGDLSFDDRRQHWGAVSPSVSSSQSLSSASLGTGVRRSVVEDEIRSAPRPPLYPYEWLVNPKLSPYVNCLMQGPRGGISGDGDGNSGVPEGDDGDDGEGGDKEVTGGDNNKGRSKRKAVPSEEAEFSVCFLGTGSGGSGSGSNRGQTSSALRVHGATYLFDVGEGTQNKIMHSRLKMGSISKIFITHMHGDHIFGIPSLLLGLQEVARINSTWETPAASAKPGGSQSAQSTKNPAATPIVQIYGPVGLYNYIATTLSLCQAELKLLRVEVYELNGGTRRWVHPGSYKSFGEFKHRSLIRRSISPNDNGTWTLETAQEIRTAEDATRYSSKPRGLNVVAAQIHHVPQLQCFGYMVEEPKTQPRTLHAEKAMALGVSPSQGKFKLLKSGFSVWNDALSRFVTADEVTSPAPPPRKAVFLGDCDGVPMPMAELCREADVLVHEATWLASQDSSDPSGSDVFVEGQHPQQQQQSQNRKNTGYRQGHSTAASAGLFADYAGVRVLALNHISPTIRTTMTTTGSRTTLPNKESSRELELLNEARRVIKGKTQVQMSYDQMEIVVPRGGFQDL